MGLKPFSIAFALVAAAAASAQMRITEWMYNDTPEFVEFTNVGAVAIGMGGWSFDDSTRTPGSYGLDNFGTVAAGESVLLVEGSSDDFRTFWGLSSSVKVLGNNTNNLGRSDEINLYGPGGVLVDRLTYNDQGGLGPRTANVSGNIPFSALGANAPGQAVLSSVGDAYGSYAATNGQIGNPGKYAPVPEPATMVALSAGVLGLMRRRRRA